MRKKGDALSTAWETINTPLVAADTAMKDRTTQAQKERKSLYLAVKRNAREREARRLASSMSVKMSNSKENAMSRIRGQSDTHTSGSIAREKQATHRHISSLMDDLPKSGPSKGVTVTKKTVSVEPLTKVTKVKKPVTICDLKKKAGINLARKYRQKKVAEKKDRVKVAYDVVQAWGRVKLASSPDQQKAEAKRFVLKVVAQREKQAEGWVDWLKNMMPNTAFGAGSWKDRVAEPGAGKHLSSGGFMMGLPRSLQQRLQQREAMTRGGAMKKGLPRSLQQRTGSTTPVDGQGLYDRVRQQQPAWQQEPLPVYPPTFGPGKGGSYTEPPAPLPKVRPASAGPISQNYNPFGNFGGAKRLGAAAGARLPKVPPAPAKASQQRWGPS